MRMVLRLALTLLLGWIVAASSLPSFGQGAAKPSNPANSRNGQNGPKDATEAEAFFDEVLGKLIVEDQDSPGAVVVIVRDGGILFAKGYGVADLERRSPVTPQDTLFYVGSVTKTFTATAVMQQVEQGKIDLNADVNRYLRSFHLSTPHGQVTTAHLLTHTAGFDDKNIGYVTLTQGEARSLGEYLAAEMPPQVTQPGIAIAYSNHGYGLAGYLVEVVSGSSFSDYIEQNILQPLGMLHSSARVPLPGNLAPNLATGYQYDPIRGQFEPQPLGFRNLPPAGTISVTGTDMARFMMAHLQDGEMDGVRILQPETARTMHAQQFTHHPRLPGIAFGFYERFRGSVRMLEHPGGYVGFTASMTLVPEDGLGIFVASNNTSSYVVNQTLGAFLDRFYPMPEAAAPPRASISPQDLARLQGAYQWTRYSRHTIEKLAIWDSQIRVTATPQGTLHLMPRGRPATEWVPIDPLLFQKVGSSELLAFREDSAGHITHFATALPNGFPGAFERLPWYESVEVQVPLALGSAAVFLTTLTLYPLVLAIVAWRRKRDARTGRVTLTRWAISAAVLTAILVIAFTLGLDALLGNSTYRTRLIYGMTPEMKALLWIPILVTALAALLTFFAVRAWQLGQGSRLHRAYFILITLAAVQQVIFYLQWNFLSL